MRFGGCRSSRQSARAQSVAANQARDSHDAAVDDEIQALLSAYFLHLTKRGSFRSERANKARVPSLVCC